MRKQLSMLVLLVLCCGFIYAQKTVTGKVTDKDGNPFPNASITVKGQNIGTISKEDGTFTLVVPESGKVLIFSGVGKAPQEITIGNRSSFEVTLQNEEDALDEVIVVGYGTQSRRDVVGSIVQVKGDVVADKPVQSFESALAGRAAGVQITVPNGVLNSAPVFRIRGTNSVNLSSQPLIVIDGMVVYSGDFSSTLAGSNVLSNINPADIESMDILKDAAATAIYGSRAANGVVVITTKKGKKGVSKLTYDGWVADTKPTRLWEILDAEQYMEIKNEGLRNAGLADRYFPDYDAQGNLINTNWIDLLYQNGTSHSHNVSVNGANDKTSYYFSASYTDQEGIVRKNTYNRKTVRLNADHKATSWLTFGLNGSYTDELNATALNTGAFGSSFASYGAARLALALPPNVAAYNIDGSYNLAGGGAVGPGKNTEAITFGNPMPILDLNKASTANSRFIGSVYAIIRPFKGLTYKTTYGIDYLTVDNNNFYTPIAGDGNGTNGSAFGTINKNRRTTFTNTLQYDINFAEKHSLSALLGIETQESRQSGFGLSSTNISDDFFTTVQGAFITTVPTGLSLGNNFLGSYIGRMNYDYDKKYFLSGVFRRDGYSAFAPGMKWGTFYSISAAYDIAKESFFQGSMADLFSTMKIRASYGTTGNISGIPNYPSFKLYNSAGFYRNTPTLNFSQAGNPNITWETSKKFDIGLSLGILNDRITAEFAYYKNDIDGLLLNVPNATSTGMPNSVLMNFGAMFNKGFEVTVNATVISNKQFSWNTSLNFTNNINEVVRLAPGVENIPGVTSLETANITLPGYSLGMTYVVESRGVDPQTGRRIFVDHNGKELLYDHSAPSGQRYTFRENGQVSPNLAVGLAQKVWKNTLPKYFGGWDNNFKYGNFDLSILMTYQLGFWVYNGTNATIMDQRFWNSSTKVMNRWQKPGDQTNVPRLVYSDNTSNGSAFPISENVEKGDFLKLRTITLGYTFNNSTLSKLNLSNARIYFSAQNPLILTKYTGPDPETSTNGTSNVAQGVDRNGVGNARVLTLGVNVGF